MLKAVLFDLDGTLALSGDGIINSVMYASKKLGIHISDKRELCSFIGQPLAETFQKTFGLSEIETQKAIKHYREYFSAYGIYENIVYDGIPELLKALRNKKINIALATAKPQEYAIRILKHLDLCSFFDHIGAATMDGSINMKADVIACLLEQLGTIDRSSILMIGDRAQDIIGAKANRLSSAGVLWGYGSIEELVSAGADHLISKPADILNIL